MRNRSTVFALLVSLAAAAAALTLSGCSSDQAADRAAPPPLPQVPVARVIARTVNDSETFTGRFSAVHHVNVRPRVTGYIAAVNFTDGSMVKKGQVLFVIDPRPYRATYQEAAAQLDQARSRLELAKSDQARAVRLYAAHAVSREELDTRDASAIQAKANVEAAKAALEQAALNLSFTRVTSPISGRVGRAIVTAGNLVTSGQTLLTTVVSLNPIYVTFNADERAYLKFEKYAHLDGREDAPNRGRASDGLGNPVYVGLQDETGYPHQGRLVFLNNALDAGTGTIRARALLANPGDVFVPGLFARVKLIGNDRYKAVLVNDSAIGTDQTVRYVLVVGKSDRIRYQPVELGPMIDGLRVVRKGLNPGDTIVVSGLMRVRPGMQVTPQLVAMGRDDETYSVMMARNASRRAIHLAANVAKSGRQTSTRMNR